MYTRGFVQVDSLGVLLVFPVSFKASSQSLYIPSFHFDS